MRNLPHCGRSARLIAAIAVMTLAGSAATAAQLVTFARGQSIVVQSSEYKGGWYYFTLEGGGQVGVPADRVAKIEDYEAAPPLAPAAAPPGAAPAVAANAPGAQAAAKPVAAAGSPAAPAAMQPASGAVPQPPSQPNVAAQGNDDWRYKARMSGGPRPVAVSPYGMAGVKTAPGGGRLPAGAMRPGGTGRVVPFPPQQPQTPTN